jgi:uncharacterized membrane protein
VKLIKSIFVLFLLTIYLNPVSQAATVHGMIYSWTDFDRPLRNAIVEVNSTPVQSKVATNGTYSFDLFPGNYTINAKYYRNNFLELINEENISIEKEGNFTLDILLFPPTESEYEFLGDINFTNISGDLRNEVPANPDQTIFYVIILISLILLIAGLYWFGKKRAGMHTGKEIPENDVVPEMDDTSSGKQIETLPDHSEMPQKNISTTNSQALNINEETKNKKLPDDLQELYEAIMNSGGRVTQKDLRKKFTCSEAKVSLMLADLEDRGLIKKIKRGRANIIIAEPQK